MEHVSGWLERTFGVTPEVQGDVVATLAVVVGLLLLRRLFLRLTLRRVEDREAIYRWRKLSGYVTFPVALLVLAAIWFEAFRSVSTFLGLLSAGLAIALRDPIVNVAAWAFIVWRKPFEVGDRVQIAEHAGDVVDQRIFQFSLMEIGNWVEADQATGRIVHVSNAKIFTEPIANYSKPFQYIWDEIPVLVTFESDWEKAKRILEVIGRRHGKEVSEAAQPEVLQAARTFLLPLADLAPTVYTSTRDSGVLLTLRYLAAPTSRRRSQHAIWEDVLREFARHADIDFAYPTQRFFDNLLEGKEGARAGADEERGEKSSPPSPVLRDTHAPRS